jgi:hypothetical protein
MQDNRHRNIFLPTKTMESATLSDYDDEIKRSILSEWLSTCRTIIQDIPDYVCCDRRGRVFVRVRVHVMSLYDIDTVDQSFDAKLRIQLKWTVVKVFEEIDLDNHPEHEWRPSFEVINNVDKLSMNVIKLEKKQRGIHTDMYLDATVQGKFSEHFELEQFPIDQERLHVKLLFTGSPVSIKRMRDEVPLEIPFHKRVAFYQIPGRSVVFRESFIQPDVWNLDRNLVIKYGKTLSERNDDGVRYGTMDICMTVDRRMGFYTLNVIFPVYLLVNLSFTSFIIEPLELADRLDVTLTLLLTLVALKFVIVQYLPTTSYVTYLDKYVLCSFVFVTMVAIQNVIIYWLISDVVKEDQHRDRIASITDMTTGCILAGVWNVLHIVMCIILKGNIRKKFITSKEKDLEGDEVEYLVKARHSTPSTLLYSDSTLTIAES